MNATPEFRRDFLTFTVGYGLAICLTATAFAFVFFRVLAPEGLVALVSCLALVQIVVHMRCFLHISLKRSARADLALILFSAGIILMMVSGTLVVVLDQNWRMMR